MSTVLVHAPPRCVAPYGLYVTKAGGARRDDVNAGRPRHPLSASVVGMDLTALDWELHQGLALRREEALVLAAREHLVRELRAARRREAPRRRWWRRRA